MGGGASTITADALATSGDGFPTLGVRLSYYTEFVLLCGGEAALEGLCTADVCEKFIKPLTAATKSSFCHWLRSKGHSAVAPAEVFISHAWKYKFIEMIEALTAYFESTPDIIVWIDLFSINQHDEEEKSASWFTDVFKPAISTHFRRFCLVLTPWQTPIPLSRTWCLFEMFCCAQSTTRLEIAMHRSQLTDFLRSVAHNLEQEVRQLLRQVDVERSVTTKSSDKDKILSAIERTVGVTQFDTIVAEQLKSWLLSAARTSTRASHPRLLVPTVEDRAEAVEEDDTKTLIFRRVEMELALASLHLSQGEFDEAESIFLTCLQVSKEELGDSHPCTSTVRNNLAVLYDAMGRFEEAEDLLLLVLSGNRRQQEKLDRNTTTTAGRASRSNNTDDDGTTYVFTDEQLREERWSTYNNLASVYVNQQRYEIALEVYTILYNERKQSVGESSRPETSTTVFRSAEQESSAQQSSTSQRSADDRQRHQEELFATMNHLATVYEKLGQVEEAESMLQECIALQSAALGKDHLDTISTISSLAGVYFGQQKYAEAEPFLQTCLSARRVKLGEAHPLTLATMQSLSMTLFCQEKYAEAEDVLIPCLEQRQRVLGKSHMHTIETASTLAMVFQQQDKTAEAKVFFTLCYETQRKELGVNHPETLEHMCNLAVFLDNIGDRAEAVSLAREAWPLCKAQLGTDSAVSQALAESFPEIAK